jgi:hypothetical protein
MTDDLLDWVRIEESDQAPLPQRGSLESDILGDYPNNRV